MNPPEGSHSLRSAPGPECTLKPYYVLEGHKGNPARVLGFNPKMGMLASGGLELVRKDYTCLRARNLKTFLLHIGVLATEL